MSSTNISTNPEKQPVKRWLNIVLLTLFSLISLVVADRIFILYENARLVPKLPEINATDPVNLATLRYNEGLVERHSPDGTFRVLSFGDSFAYSIVEPELSYNGVLQNKLQDAVADQRIKVVNLGEPATGTRHYRAAYDFWSQIFTYQAVLFHIYLGNDVLDDAYVYSSIIWEPNTAVVNPKHPALEAGSRLVPRKFPLRMMDYAYAFWMSSRSQSGQNLPDGYNWAALVDFDDETFLELNFKHMESFNPQKMPALLPGYEQIALLLTRAQEVSDKGIPVAVVLGPSETLVNQTLRTAVFKAGKSEPDQFDMGLQVRIIKRLRALVAPDVALVDLVEPFQEYHQMTGDRLFFRHNMHWDKEGNRLAGELIAGHLLETWFSQSPTDQIVSHGKNSETENILVSDVEIDQYLAPLTNNLNSPRPVITGAAREIQMMDGITGDPDNWALGGLGQPIIFEFAEALNLSAIKLHLYDADSRTYRLTVEAGLDGEWRSIADHSETGVGGILNIPLPGGPLDSLRITGLDNSRLETNPGNTFIHIYELELIENQP